MNIETLETELKINQENACRYAALIKSLESDESCGVILSTKDSAALIGYRFQLKQAIHQCEFISKRIAIGDTDSLVLGGGQVKEANQAMTKQSTGESMAYLEGRGLDSLVSGGWGTIKAMQQGK